MTQMAARLRMLWPVLLALAVFVAVRQNSTLLIIASVAYLLWLLVQEHRGQRPAVTGRGDADQAAAEAARAAEQQLSAVLESVTEGILQIDSNARFVLANPAARRLLHLPADVTGQAVSSLIRHPELRVLLADAAASRRFEPLELTLDDRHLLISPQPLKAGNGAVVAIVDLTEVRRLEAVRRDFVANVSHELKTPLTSIRGYAETLLNDDVLPETQRQFLEVIARNSTRLQRIVEDLLDLSRLQSGAWQPQLQPLDAVRAAQDAWAQCDGAEQKHISFAVQSSRDCMVLADADGLRHVFDNVFDNAIRYTAAGGKITFSVECLDAEVQLRITDTGTGIPRDALPRVFERFYRVDPARSRQDGGTGLGLSIVRHLVEGMGGSVWAESELGRGTTIHIKLPAQVQT